MTIATFEFEVFVRQLLYLFDLVFFGFHWFSLNSCMTDENYRLTHPARRRQSLYIHLLIAKPRLLPHCPNQSTNMRIA